MANKEGGTPAENDTIATTEAPAATPATAASPPPSVLIDFAALRRAKKRPDRRAVVYVQPEELGHEPEELGLAVGQTIAVVIRPLESGENGEIREEIKDFAEEVWAGEYYDAILLRCVVDPAIPNDADGRDEIAGWLPGTKQVLAQGVLNQSGMGAHTLKSAKDELGKLVRVTPSTT